MVTQPLPYKEKYQTIILPLQKTLKNHSLKLKIE